MKKKKIEAIPFKRPKKLLKGKWYTEAQIADIDGVQHIFLDVWNDKKPYFRYVANKKEYGHWYPPTEETASVWDRSKLYGEIMTEPFTITKNCDEVAAVFAKDNGYYEETFKELANEIEKECLMTAVANAELRRRFKLQQRASSLKPLPKGWDKYLESILFESRLYYHRHGRFTMYYCSHCGEEYTVANKALDSYEGQFEHIEEPPKNNHMGVCSHCGHSAKYKAAGKEKNGSVLTKYIYLAQHTEGGGFVVRYFEAFKKFYPGEKEEIGCVEATRTYIRDGKSQRDFYKHDCYLGQNFWDDCNLAGLANIRMCHGAIHPASWKAISDSYMKYIPVKKIANMYPRFNLAEFAIIALKWPQLEMLYKLGYHWAIEKILESGGRTSSFDAKAKKPWDFFKVKKNRLKDIKEEPEFLDVLQLERKLNANWPRDIWERIAYVAHGAIENISRYMSAEKMVNRVFDYAGIDKDKKLSLFDRQKIQETAILYGDYLVMKDAAGFDMTNTVYLHPRNLRAAHAELVERRAQLENSAFFKKKEEKFKAISKRYRKANRHFRYADDELIIRPARSATEIIMEGRILHHCVGGDTYLGRHANGTSYILFLRFKSDPRTPYYTIEIDWDYNIKQWYAAHDKKPNKEQISEWLEKYKAHMIGQLDAAVSEKAS